VKLSLSGKGSSILLRTFSASTCLCQTIATHYDVLGIPSTSNEKEIRAAWIKKCQKHHPDHIAANPESTEDHIKKSNEIFIQINEAYEILGNKEKRILYHQELAAEEIIKTKQKFTKYDPDIGFKVVDLSGATAEERARVLHGWTVDKDYYEKQKKSNLKVAYGIVVISIVGSTIHFLIAYNVGKKHNEHLTAQTKRLQDQLDEEERLRNEQHEREKDQGWFIENVGLRNAIRKKGEELGEDGLEYLKQVDARMRNDYEKRAEKRREKKRQKREEMERKLEAEKALLPQVVPDQNHAAVAV